MSGTSESLQPGDSPAKLDDLIASYLELTDGGHEVDPAGFVAPWPQHKEEFLQFVVRYTGLNRLATKPSSDETQPLRRQTAEQLQGLESEFQLGGLLGKGGMGTVWAATRRSDQLPVAIKVLNANMSVVDDNCIRFQREARAIQSLDHPHIVPCLDVGYSGGSPYLVMKLIDGVTLSDVVAEQVRSDSNQPTVPLADSGSTATVSEADARVAECVAQAKGNDTWFQTIARLVADATAGLNAAHEISIVHRDVKPSNLMLDRSGRVWLTDFGLASIGESRTLLTATGDILGTPAFMSPEQASGKREAVDHRTDIYSLGATLYTLAARRRPYVGASFQIIRAVSEGLVTPPSKYRTDIPGDLEAIILKAMSRDPNRRYQSCDLLEKDLRQFVVGGGVQARLPGPAHRFAQTLSRHPRVTFATAIGLLFAVASVITVQSLVSTRLSGVNEQLQAGNDKLESINSELTATNDRLIESRTQMQHMVYVSDVSAAYRANWNEDTDTARRILARHMPKDDESDQRGMEWHLLDRLSRPAEITSVAAHDGVATEVAMIPGTNEFLTSGADGRVLRWRLHADSRDHPAIEQVAEFQIEGNINALAVSPDGECFVVGLVAALETNLASLHDAHTGRQIRPLSWHTTTIESAAFSPDGTMVATASRYRSASIHEVGGQLIKSIPADTRNQTISFNSNGNSLLGIGEVTDGRNRRQRSLQSWPLTDALSSQQISTDFRPQDFAVSVIGSRIVASGYDGIVLLDGDEPQVIGTCNDIRGRIRVVSISPNGQHLAAGCDNGLLHLWMNASRDADLTKPVTVDCGNAGITSVILTDGIRLSGPASVESTSSGDFVALVTCTDGSVKAVWPRGPDAFIRSPIKFQHITTASAESEVTFGCSRNGTLYRFDQIASGTAGPVELGEFTLDESAWMAASSEEGWLAMARPAEVTIVDTDSGNIEQSLPKPKPNAVVRHMKFDADRNRLIVLFHDRLLAYGTDDWSKLADVPLSEYSLNQCDVHPDDGTLWIAADSALLRLHSDTRKVVTVCELSASSSGAGATRLSHSGHLIAIGYIDGTIELRETTTDRQVAILRGHRFCIRTLVFVNNDRTLISSGDDESIRFWDIATGRQLGEIQEAGKWCDVLPAHDCILSYTAGRPLKLWSGKPRR